MPANSSYSGFDRDLLPRNRIRLVPVHVGHGDEAFSPSSLKLFAEKMDELEMQGVRVRAVVSDQLSPRIKP